MDEQALPAARLAAEIAKQNFSQIQAARKLGISQAYLSDILLGKRLISIRVALRIEKAFGLSSKTMLSDQLDHQIAMERKQKTRKAAPAWHGSKPTSRPAARSAASSPPSHASKGR